MEQEKKKKRGREDNDEAEIIIIAPSFDDHEKNNNNTAKKRDVYGITLMKENKKNKEVMVMEENNNNKGCFKVLDSSSSSSSSNLGLGVFDFPWLKDGVMSKSEQGFFLDYYCEDSFLSSLESHKDSSFKSDHHGIDYFSEEQYGLCEATSDGSIMANIPEEKLVVEDLWQPFENDHHGLDAEDVDCIWSSLLNKPL